MELQSKVELTASKLESKVKCDNYGARVARLSEAIMAMEEVIK